MAVRRAHAAQTLTWPVSALYDFTVHLDITSYCTLLCVSIGIICVLRSVIHSKCNHRVAGLVSSPPIEILAVAPALWLAFAPLHNRTCEIPWHGMNYVCMAKQRTPLDVNAMSLAR